MQSRKTDVNRHNRQVQQSSVRRACAAQLPFHRIASDLCPCGTCGAAISGFAGSLLLHDAPGDDAMRVNGVAACMSRIRAWT